MKINCTKFVSLLLTVMLLLTTLFAVTAIPSSATDADLTLYVCSPGYDKYDTTAATADGTEGKPFETVYDLITYVNANTDLGAGDTVKVIVEELADIKAFASAVHSMTSWTDQVVSAEAIVPSHAYTLYITSPNGEKNHLAFSHKLAANCDLMIGGPTVFDNVILANNTNNVGKNVAFEGSSVTFTENCAFQYTKNASTSQFGTLVDFALDVQVARAANAGKTVTYAGATYNLESAKTGNFIFGSNRAYKLFPTYTEDVNINVNNAALPLNFKWGSNVGAAANSTIKFSKNLNINIKAAASATNVVYNKGTVVIDGGLQVIYPENVDFDMSAITNLTAGSKWFLVNKTGNPDAISFTAAAGVYSVASGLTLAAKDATGKVVKTSNDGVLDLSLIGAGTYSIVEGGDEPEAPSISYDYYVKNPGYNAYGTTEADGTQEKPFETVYDLITFVNEKHPDLKATDTVNAVILQRDDYNTAYGTATIGGASTGVHSTTAWSYINDGDYSTIVPKYNFTLRICSPAGQKNYLAFSAKMGDNMDMKLNGPTVFDNVVILNPYYNGESKTVCLEGNNATFTENCAWAWAKTYTNGTWTSNSIFENRAEFLQMVRARSGSYTYNTPIDITMNAPVGNGTKSPFKFYIPSSRTNNTPVTYNKDVNITVNNANAKLDFNWGIGYATPTLTFGQNLNINIKDATTITNTISKSAIVITGGLQVIYPEDVTFDMSAITNLTAGSKWYLVNKTGNTDAISFTETAGLYSVAEGLTVSAVDANGNGVKTSENGVLDLTSVGAGTYSIVEGEVSGGGETPDPEQPEVTVTKEYSKYITYRGDLDNTRAKLKANGDVNVVYFGGSVTAGAGASDKDATSWRALTGNWIKSAFPNANVTNYDQAVGETGTYLGCYRVARDIIGKNPDLLFIEYSINDYYNHTGYARASLQFETIVRQVKEKLPNCEIVTILVTDFNQAKNALKGELHAAAKAHFDISEIYGLPVINVGFALADTLGSGWVPAASYKEDAVWSEYVADLVHPKDKGYQVYFNVIKEYLSNNLIYEYNGETAFTELTALPKMVNKYLLNGDVTFIKPSKDLIVKNEANTATTRKLAYDTSRGGMCDGYGGTNGNIIWFGAREDCGDILRFEFTGTEIVMIATALTDGEYSMISIDGGEAYRVDHTSRPVVLATGLSSGKHTIEFKQITKSASLIINGFYTRDYTKATNTLNICDLVHADNCINGFVTPNTTDFFDYSNNWADDAADIGALKQILLNK